ncbi:MAG: amidohydrolase [Pirellulales bacterium]|nr:amidohydrolase [Pirellulales bacterium]
MNVKYNIQTIMPVILVLSLSVIAFAQGKYVEVPPAAQYKEKQFVFDWLSRQEVHDKYGKMSDAIWSYAELGMQEFKSMKVVADDLEEAGFTVKRGVSGMPTAFMATWGSGKPVVGLMMEYDALPSLSQKGMTPTQDPVVAGAPGHGCGHNQQGPAVNAAALALKAAMEKFGIRGTIKVFGGPAEETLVSRAYMARDHLFSDVDVLLSNHGAPEFGTFYGTRGNAMFSAVFSFKGKTAHSASGPWEARSALDAVEIMNVSVNFLREHLFYSSRIHYVITNGGEAPNVVPDKASVWYFVRNSDDKVESDYEKVVNCAKGAALATGTELSIRVLTAIHQSHTPKTLAELAQRNMELVGMPEWTEEERAFARALQKELGKEEKGMPTEVKKLEYWDPNAEFTGGGSGDMAEVRLQTANVSIRFPGEVPGLICHHWSTTTCNYGSATHKGIIAGAKAMAATLMDILTNPEELKKVRDEFEKQAAQFPYKTYLPEGTKPPVDLNRELMEKWRPLMEPHYLPYP